MMMDGGGKAVPAPATVSRKGHLGNVKTPLPVAVQGPTPPPVVPAVARCWGSVAADVAGATASYGGRSVALAANRQGLKHGAAKEGATVARPFSSAAALSFLTSPPIVVLAPASRFSHGDTSSHPDESPPLFPSSCLSTPLLPPRLNYPLRLSGRFSRLSHVHDIATPLTTAYDRHESPYCISHLAANPTKDLRLHSRDRTFFT